MRPPPLKSYNGSGRDARDRSWDFPATRLPTVDSPHHHHARSLQLCRFDDRLRFYLSFERDLIQKDEGLIRLEDACVQKLNAMRRPASSCAWSEPA
jgi:hypothetical protein